MSKEASHVSIGMCLGERAATAGGLRAQTLQAPGQSSLCSLSYLHPVRNSIFTITPSTGLPALWFSCANERSLASQQHRGDVFLPVIGIAHEVCQGSTSSRHLQRSLLRRYGAFSSEERR